MGHGTPAYAHPAAKLMVSKGLSAFGGWGAGEGGALPCLRRYPTRSRIET